MRFATCLPIDLPVADELPPDGVAAGFDNIGDALSMSPLLAGTVSESGAAGERSRSRSERSVSGDGELPRA